MANVAVAPGQHPAIDVRTLFAREAFEAVPRATRIRPVAFARYERDPEALADGGVPVSALGVDEAATRGTWWPVIDATETTVRVASRDDETVVAVWIDRTWLATSIVTATTMRRAGKELGVALSPGAEVEVGADGQVALVHPLVEVRGEVAPAAIGDVFERPQLRRSGFGPQIKHDVDVWSTVAPVPGASPVGRLRAGAMVQPDDDGGVAARRAVTFADGLVELHGYVERSAVSASVHSVGTGSGHSIGASHAKMLPTPAGTCLYAPHVDEIVGITVSGTLRHAYDTADPAWWTVLVWTPWGIDHLRVQDTAAAGTVDGARLRSCLP